MDLHASPDPQIDPVLRGAEKVLRGLRRWHRHRALGLEHVPLEGPALLVVNHSLATYDVGLLGLAIYDETGRIIRGLGDRSLFRTPGVRRVIPRLGVVEGHPGQARALLDAGALVVVAPGGMREALRPSRERHTVQWSDRQGFARLALHARVPVLLAACPRADEVFTVYDSRVTRATYRALRLPLPVARGLGPTALPRPVPLTHVIRAPIHPPPLPSPEEHDAVLAGFHAHLLAEMERLLVEGLAAR